MTAASGRTFCCAGCNGTFPNGARGKLKIYCAPCRPPGLAPLLAPAEQRATCTCKICGAQFEKVAAQGRMPDRCDLCRGSKAGDACHLTCDGCRREFIYVRRGRGAFPRYCTLACRAASQPQNPPKPPKPARKLTCERCRTMFDKPTGTGRDPRLCGRCKVWGAATRFDCAECGQLIRKNPGDPQRRCDECIEANSTAMERARKYGIVIRRALRNGSRSRIVERGLGFTIAELRHHLERGFKRGMTWDKFFTADIHIDHIVPLSRFDLSADEGIRAAWALTNLQPLWAEHNVAKGAKRLTLL